MKSRIAQLLLLALGLCLAIFVAAVSTADKTRYKNDFVRIFPPHAADINKTFKIDKQNLSAVALTNQSVYLRSGSELVELSLDMLDTCRVAIDNLAGRELIIDSPFFFLQSGVSALLQRGNTLTWCVDTTFQLLPGFIAVQPIARNSAILQVIDFNNRKSLFTKLVTPELQKDILEKQVDGIICTDGFLRYSKEANTLVYAYRYRNQFLCLDTNLNVLRKGKTIDTTSIARISVSEIDGKITMSKPPFVVNKAICVDAGNLFVNSNLVARNELIEDVSDRSVVDVYDIRDASYKYSFYLHDEGGTKLRGFIVRDTILIAIFPDYVVRYDLASKYIKN